MTTTHATLTPAPAHTPPDLNACRPRLMAYARKRLSPQDAEDVVQDAFLGILASGYDGSFPAINYLLGICAHKITDHFRRKARRPQMVSLADGGRTDADMPAFPQVASTKSPDELAMAAEETRAVLAAVAAEVTAAERSRKADGHVFRAIFVDHMDASEVSAACGVTPQSARMAKHRGIQRIRERLIAARR